MERGLGKLGNEGIVLDQSLLSPGEEPLRLGQGWTFSLAPAAQPNALPMTRRVRAVTGAQGGRDQATSDVHRARARGQSPLSLPTSRSIRHREGSLSGPWTPSPLTQAPSHAPHEAGPQTWGVVISDMAPPGRCTPGRGLLGPERGLASGQGSLESRQQGEVQKLGSAPRGHGRTGAGVLRGFTERCPLAVLEASVPARVWAGLGPSEAARENQLPPVSFLFTGRTPLPICVQIPLFTRTPGILDQGLP